MPSYEQFAPEALGDEVWQNCCTLLLRKSHEKWIYTYDFTGNLIRPALGKELKRGVGSLGINGFQEARLLNKAEEMLKTGEPLADEGHFVNDQSKIIKFRSCLLPFGRGKDFTHIVIGLSWRAF